MDTIFALASAQGKAGVAVIRLSGPNAFAVAARLTGAELPPRGMACEPCGIRAVHGLTMGWS